jgi:hypothetical protein
MSTSTEDIATVETLENYLENARVAQAPVLLVLSGNVHEPLSAYVRARNGSTFEFVVGPMVLRMDLAAIVVRTA